jgi:galactose mutarotase-like enzyme
MNLQNEYLSLTVSLKAAEMTSLIDKKSGKEILWNGDPAYWAGRNPILFPIVGSTFDKKIHINGSTYEMGNHGFARQSDFELNSQNEKQIILSLKANEFTLSQYPFNFTLNVSYTLNKASVNIDYLIVNNDEKTMPFSFGLHPAFALDDPQEAHIEFPHKESYPNLIDQHKTNMNDEFFSKIPTFLTENLKSPYVDLLRKDLKIRVSCEGYRWVAFWKKPKAAFLCIEPWHGHGDFSETTTDFTQREGTINLEPKDSFSTSYSITITPH